MRAPEVSVIIPYFNDQAGLDLVLTGLAEQTLAAGRFEVIVADDGSPQPPVVPDHVQVVRQPDLGFRAGAARNLGAQRARGGTLVFLDGDTVPTTTYLEHLAPACKDGHTLAVGARRHVDLTGWTAARLRAFLHGVGESPRPVGDPQWLADGYAATDNLRRADDASFRFIISAVLALPAALFRRVGGFDESFTQYGGEDWDLAYRCWLAGAQFRHVPDAIALHDGGDAATRGDLAGIKNGETAHLARTLTHPIVRGRGLVFAIPDIVITTDTTGWTDGQVMVTTQSLLAGSDAGIWFTGQQADRHRDLLGEDPRVHTGPVPDHTLARCRFQIHLDQPAQVPGTTLGEVMDALPAGAEIERAGTLYPTRELNRARWLGLRDDGATPLPRSTFQPVAADIVVEHWRANQLVTSNPCK